MGKKKRVREEKRARQREEMERVMKVLYDKYTARVRAKKMDPPPYEAFCDMFIMGYDASKAETVQGKINEAVSAIIDTNLAVHHSGNPQAFMKDKTEQFDKTMREKAAAKAETDRMKRFENEFPEEIYGDKDTGPDMEAPAGQEGGEGHGEGGTFAEDDIGQNVGGLTPY